MLAPTIMQLPRCYETTVPGRKDSFESKRSISTKHVEDIDDLEVKPVLVEDDSAFGAEVYGVDWSKPISDELIQRVSLTICR